jgi:hypothetical protein
MIHVYTSQLAHFEQIGHWVIGAVAKAPPLLYGDKKLRDRKGD